MALLRGEDRDTWTRIEIVQRPVHRIVRRERGERLGECVAARVGVELDALQEQPGFGIGVLIGFEDVAARVRDERADARDDARPVGALEQQRGTHEN